MSKQQQQTHHYFSASATDWQKSAIGRDKSEVNFIAQRNANVIRVARSMDKVRKFLDVGCGTGQLVLDLAREGVHSVGVDFAPEMIQLSNASKNEAGLDNAEFITQSIFDFPFPEQPFDLVSALGFIQYVSAEELRELCVKLNGMLRVGGDLVVSARNRLFNIFSLNVFTEMEYNFGIIQDLHREALNITKSATQAEAVDAVRNLGQPYPQPDSHPQTSGIDIAVRFQHTPSELVFLLESTGFEVQGLFPVHFHGLPMAVKDEHTAIHVELANLMFVKNDDDHRLIPQSSAFVVDAIKVSD